MTDYTFGLDNPSARERFYFPSCPSLLLNICQTPTYLSCSSLNFTFSAKFPDLPKQKEVMPYYSVAHPLSNIFFKYFNYLVKYVLYFK